MAPSCKLRLARFSAELKLQDRAECANKTCVTNTRKDCKGFNRNVKWEEDIFLYKVKNLKQDYKSSKARKPPAGRLQKLVYVIYKIV